MEANKTATVLVAELGVDAKRSEPFRRAATQAVLSAADSTGGLVVSTVGGKLVLRFATADAAASAASKIHAALDGLPAVNGAKPGIHIGFHTGPVMRSGWSPADETINLALRLAEKAQDGETVTSRQTAEQLNPAFRGQSRAMLSLQDETPMCTILSWHQKGEQPSGWAAMAVLRLTYRDQLAVCSREKETVVIGREADSDLVVNNGLASRRHCSVRYRDGGFAVFDHSRNGTYVTAGESDEVRLSRSGVLLPQQGVIAIGKPRGDGADAVEFCLASVT